MSGLSSLSLNEDQQIELNRLFLKVLFMLNFSVSTPQFSDICFYLALSRLCKSYTERLLQYSINKTLIFLL